MMLLCWLHLHWWGKWSDPRTVKFMSDENGYRFPVEISYTQSRLCRICGKFQSRTVPED